MLLTKFLILTILRREMKMREKALRALEYMALKPGTPVTDVIIDPVFIGSCTNSRLEDLLEASLVVKGKQVSSKVRAMVIPGSKQ